MNPNLVDQLLRKAPLVRTPAGLLEKLEATIQLPRATATATNHPLRDTHSSWFRRWMPALGFALWFLGCVVVFGIQASRMAGLLEQQRALESAKVDATQQALSAEAARIAAATELEQLKKQWAEVQKLRPEIEQLRADMQELAALREQNQQLREELKAQAASAPKPEEDFFAVAQARAERIKCVQHLKQLGLAALIWANNSKSDRMPDLATLKAYLPNLRGSDNMRLDEKLLVCPTDGTSSYEIVSPGVPLGRHEFVYSRCPIHNSIGLSDGSVQQIDPNHVHMVQKDGWWVLERR